MNRSITREEVILAICRLKKGKAAGPDGMIGEMLKHAGNRTIDFFVKLFDVLFYKGVFPEKWTKSVVEGYFFV